MSNETSKDYELLVQCYMSGQVSEKQWAEHLQDPEFQQWFIAKAHGQQVENKEGSE